MRGRGWQKALVFPAVLACSPTDAVPVGDAGSDEDAIVVADRADDNSAFLFDAPACPSDLAPGKPCSMTNMICTAPVRDCEPCLGGFVVRAAVCTCGAFWNCDECPGSCGACGAGVVYQDPSCTIPEPPLTDGGADVVTLDGGGDDAGQDGGGGD